MILEMSAIEVHGKGNSTFIDRKLDYREGNLQRQEQFRICEYMFRYG